MLSAANAALWLLLLAGLAVPGIGPVSAEKPVTAYHVPGIVQQAAEAVEGHIGH